MTVYTHNVVAVALGAEASGEVNVLDAYPTSMGGQISESSSGVSLRQMRTLITRAAGQLNAALARHGMVPDDLGDADTTATVQAGIIAYVVSRTLMRIGRYEDAAEWAEEWTEILTMMRTDPQSLGAAQEQKEAVQSNIDTSPDRAAKRYGSSFKGW